VLFRSLLFTWETISPIPHLTHYNVYLSLDHGPYYLADTTTGYHYTLEVGAASNEHEYNLMLEYETDSGKKSITYEATAILTQEAVYTRVLLTPPATPEVHHIGESNPNYDDDTHLDFTWTDVSPTSKWFNTDGHYSVYYRVVYNQTYKGPLNFLTNTVHTSYTLEVTQTNMTYELVVVAIDGAGNKSDTGESEMVFVTNIPTTPSTPIHVNNDDSFYIPPKYDNDPYLHFSWSEPIPSDAVQINIYVGTSEADALPIVPVDKPTYTMPAASVTDWYHPDLTVDVTTLFSNPDKKNVAIKISFTNSFGLTSELSETSEPYPVFMLINPPDKPNT
jgi:hypothetical protein